jgi:hypothetical protein
MSQQTVAYFQHVQGNEAPIDARAIVWVLERAAAFSPVVLRERSSMLSFMELALLTLLCKSSLVRCDHFLDKYFSMAWHPISCCRELIQHSAALFSMNNRFQGRFVGAWSLVKSTRMLCLLSAHFWFMCRPVANSRIA